MLRRISSKKLNAVVNISIYTTDHPYTSTSEENNTTFTIHELNETLAALRKEQRRVGMCKILCITWASAIIVFFYLEQLRNSSGLERNLLYPLCFFILLAMTVHREFIIHRATLVICRLYHLCWSVLTQFTCCSRVALSLEVFR